MGYKNTKITKYKAQITLKELPKQKWIFQFSVPMINVGIASVGWMPGYFYANPTAVHIIPETGFSLFWVGGALLNCKPFSSEIVAASNKDSINFKWSEYKH